MPKDDTEPTEVTEVYATRDQIESLLNSILWNDIVRELNAWSKGYENELAGIVDDAQKTNPSTASVLMHMGEINGCQKAIRYIIDLPNRFLEVLEERKNDSGRNKTS